MSIGNELNPDDLSAAQINRQADTQIAFEKLAADHPYVRGSEEYTVAQASGAVPVPKRLLQSPPTQEEHTGPTAADRAKNDAHFKELASNTLKDSSIKPTDKLDKLHQLDTNANMMCRLAKAVDPVAELYTSSVWVQALLDPKIGQSEELKGDGSHNPITNKLDARNIVNVMRNSEDNRKLLTGPEFADFRKLVSDQINIDIAKNQPPIEDEPIGGETNRARNDDCFKKQASRILNDSSLSAGAKLKQLDDSLGVSMAFYQSGWADSVVTLYTYQAKIKADLDPKIGQSEGQNREKNKADAVDLARQIVDLDRRADKLLSGPDWAEFRKLAREQLNINIESSQ